MLSRPLARAARRAFLLIPMGLMTAAAASAQSLPGVPLNVKWAAPTANEDGSCLTGAGSTCSNDLAGYRIYRSASTNGASPTAPSYYASVSASTTSFKDTQVTIGTRYYYQVTSVDSHGNESGKLVSVSSLALPPTTDDDGDGSANGVDNCPLVSNPGQEDSNADGIGDACQDSGPGCADTDGDGICNTDDNCARTSNADQTDANGNGVGDVCERATARLTCQRDTADAFSSIALMSDSNVLLVNPVSTNASSAGMDPGGNAAVGNFMPEADGIAGFGALELLESHQGSDGAGSCEINSASKIESVSFGSNGDEFFGCYIDGDNELDLVAANKKRVVARVSSHESEYAVSLSKLGKILQVTCGDMIGDARDEFVVLHLSKVKSARAKPKMTVSVIDPISGKVKKSIEVDAKATRVAVAYSAPNAKGKACTLSKASSKVSYISCSKNPKGRILVPAAKDFAAGRYDPAARTDGFAVLAGSSKLAIVNQKGKLRAVASAQLGINPRDTAAKMRLAPCR